MNIKILDSWLREFVTTKASAKKIADALSLTSVSVEKVEKIADDFVYDIEVTTNRPDLMSVVGLAREAATILPEFGIDAKFIPRHLSYSSSEAKSRSRSSRQARTINFPIIVKNDPRLVNRICAVVLEVEVKPSPHIIKNRLETSDIRSLNNLVDVTNYIMREVGHPAHVFDFDRLNTKKMIIRESKKGEKIVTLDKKEHILPGGDIVADNGTGEIIDLLGIMGTVNSVVTDTTKRILLFIDDNDPSHIRKTSMALGIRTDAAVLNEKGVDPELAMQALLQGIAMYQKIANGKIISPILDIYPNKVKTKTLIVPLQKINEIIGIPIPVKTAMKILNSLGFATTVDGEKLHVQIPTWRINDVTIEEDIIEEIARVYGYHKLPSILPPLSSVAYHHKEKDSFSWEKRAKDVFKYWGFTEVYTYSMVSEELLEGPTSDAVELANPLSKDLVYMRRSLVPSLLQTVWENKIRETVKIFEIANVYQKREGDLPRETQNIAGIIKKEDVSFYEVKGVIEQLCNDLAIKNVYFVKKDDGGEGADVLIGKEKLGTIEALQEDLIDFEIDFGKLIAHASVKKAYKPIAKYPPIIEDVRFITDPAITYAQIVNTIKKQSKLVVDVSLLDIFEDKKTFRITYQHPEKNLTDEEVAKEREKIIDSLEKHFAAAVG